ncbi:hypothetical protein GCM10010420_12170 [Streptomyces glaucosporus]|uniref:Uncharacterized protein n=1 Tax=Streptomyces glaucosporus TaxID=284044 RepID=A0ABN3HX80_9ACTN
MGPVVSLLTSEKGLPPTPVRDADRAVGTPVAPVGAARDAGLGEGVDDAVGADGVDGVGQGRSTAMSPGLRPGEPPVGGEVTLAQAGQGLVQTRRPRGQSEQWLPEAARLPPREFRSRLRAQTGHEPCPTSSCGTPGTARYGTSRAPRVAGVE